MTDSSLGEMRGRALEQRMVGDLLRHAARRTGGVMLVEGEPGIGRSRLLCEATAAATGQGFSLAAGAANQVGRAIPFFALRAALGEPFTKFAGDSVDQEVHGGPAWWIGQMRAYLERCAASAPMLVCLDDLQWASPATLAALLSLPQALKHDSVAWVLARSSTPQPDVEFLFDGLAKDGAERIVLTPLDDDTVAALLTDAFGATPDQNLMALAAAAGGNPSLVLELIGGLIDDDAVQVDGDRAMLVSGRLPQRVHRVVRHRLDSLGERARNLLVTASVLDPSFRLEDAAEMIGETPAALLPAVEETMAAGIITTAQNAFCFRHQLLRRALGEMIPQAGRTALHRQYGHLLLGRGDATVQAADHLLQAVNQDDQASLADFDTAVVRISQSAPQTAANLALRAFDLTPAADPAALPRAVAAAEALASASRLDHAASIAQATLAKPLPPTMEARLRCALSSVLLSRGRARDAAAEARMALVLPSLGPDLRDRAMAAQLRALSDLHDELAEPTADTILADQTHHDIHVVVAALAAQGVARWDKGRIGEALDLMRDAARQAAGSSFDAHQVQPLLALAAALIDLRELGQADEILRAASSEPVDGIPAQAALSALRARIHLIQGRHADAHAAAQRALATADKFEAHGYAAAAHHVLGLIALRRGDIAAAAHHIACQSEAAPHYASPHWRTETALVRAQIIDARDDATVAYGQIRQAADDLVSHRGLLLRAPGTAAWLVRTALAAGDTQLASVLAGAAGTLAADNPGYPVITAIAEHSLGLVDQDPARLTEAAAQHPDRWAKASAAEDLGVLHIRRADRGKAILEFGRAIEGYELTGATADTARVRSRLRKLGVRKRHWTQSSDRPVTGWGSLTDHEHRVSELVADGLNNGQIAARLYLTSSTVAFHLRQIFRKLEIGSRVELARIVIQRNLSAPRLPADTGAVRSA